MKDLKGPWLMPWPLVSKKAPGISPGRILSDMYLTGAVHDSVVRHEDFTYAVHCNVAAAGILDGIHMTVDIGLHIGVFKGQVGGLHGAVNELQILTVAQGLGADDVAIDEGQTFGEPGQAREIYIYFTFGMYVRIVRFIGFLGKHINVFYVDAYRILRRECNRA